MILLIGGTSELYPLSQALIDNGLKVLVSTATNINLNLPQEVKRRCGRLTALNIVELCISAGIKLIIDAGHPFAYALHAACIEASAKVNIPLLRFARPPSNLPIDIVKVPNHKKAAELAFSYNVPVLLTIGSQNLMPYVLHARRNKLPIIARVLNYNKSINACIAAGLTKDEFVVGRGPFSVKNNIDLIRKCGDTAILVSKDSGQAGGLQTKIEAAKQTNCKMIVIVRKAIETKWFEEFHHLAAEAKAISTN